LYSSHVFVRPLNLEHGAAFPEEYANRSRSFVRLDAADHGACRTARGQH